MMPNPYLMGMFNLHSNVQNKDIITKDTITDQSNNINNNLLDVRAFTTNQDSLLKRPFKSEIVNPLNRKLHNRSCTSN